MAQTCTVEGCEKAVTANGLCAMHYARLRRTGTTDDPRLSETDRFWRFVDRRGPDECWPWTGFTQRGYGRFGQAKPLNGLSAHRHAYELIVGPIPEGLTIDHTCHDPDECAGGVDCPHRRCCNPAHLEPIERGENTMRGNTITAMNAAKTYCIAGHLFDETNTRIDPRTGDRVCRACARERMRGYRGRA